VLQISQDCEVYLITSRCYLQIFGQIELSHDMTIGIHDFIP